MTGHRPKGGKHVMPWKQTGPGIFRAEEATSRFSKRDIGFLVSEARDTPKRRSRICAHSTLDDPVHEMLICLLGDGYVRPHRHNKPESLHVIEGECDLIVFDEAGGITDITKCNATSGGCLYVRMMSCTYHTMCVRSEYLIFHETVAGPFDPSATEPASWAPLESEAEAASAYLEELEAAISCFQSDVAK